MCVVCLIISVSNVSCETILKAMALNDGVIFDHFSVLRQPRGNSQG